MKSLFRRRLQPRSNLPRMPLKTLAPLLKTLIPISAAVFGLYVLLHPTPFRSPAVAITTNAPASAFAVGDGALQLRHLAFGIASSSRTFDRRKDYMRLWWRPGTARGFVFLEKSLNLSGEGGNLPTIVVSADSSRFPYTFKSGLRSAVRGARIVKELVEILDRDQGLHYGDVKWIVLGDDDTLFFMENLIKTLAKYDWEQWYYIGGLSEGVEQNTKNSFGMAFGGAGFAISYPLAKVLSKVLDSCLLRYGHLYGSDARVYVCLAELGVGLTHEPGFHQVDLRGDLFGMLSAHPLAPVVSLHHLDVVEPLYPGMNRVEAFRHLFEAVEVDPGRVFQQTVCYDHLNLRTMSVSWGYAVQVYEGNLLLPDLLSVQQTFTPWRRKRDISSHLYMFNTREFSRDPCKRPAVFFFETVLASKNRSESSYKRHAPANCEQNVGSTMNLQKVRVLTKKLDVQIGQLLALRRHCCDVLASSTDMIMEIDIRNCKQDELISMNP